MADDLQNVIPKWAILTEAESRQLYKPEAAPINKGRRQEETYLLRFFRKLTRRERLKVHLLANSLAADRIRSRLAKRRARHG